MNLKKHIEAKHDNNISEFARSIGESLTQVRRWIALDCIWYKGNVWQNKSKLTGNSK